jgi:hypothetical protein
MSAEPYTDSDNSLIWLTCANHGSVLSGAIDVAIFHALGQTIG